MVKHLPEAENGCVQPDEEGSSFSREISRPSMSPSMLTHMATKYIDQDTENAPELQKKGQFSHLTHASRKFFI
jgi:hypothetical protein